MLVLSRRESERIRLGDSIQAPPDMLVLRDELEPKDASGNKPAS